MNGNELKQIISGSGLSTEAAEALYGTLEPHLADQTIYTVKDRRSGGDQRQEVAPKGDLVNKSRRPVQRIVRLPGELEWWIYEQRSGLDRRANVDA